MIKFVAGNWWGSDLNLACPASLGTRRRARHNERGSRLMTAAKLHVTTSLATITVNSPYDGSDVGTVDATDA
ncbi:MAG: hypothetical protein E5W15_17180, partial [Mesorhizobium sp.]